MASSLHRLCFTTTFPFHLSSSSTSENPSKVQNFSFPMITPSSPKVVYSLFDESPKRVCVLTANAVDVGYVSDSEKGVLKNGFSTSTDTSHDDGDDKSLLDRQYRQCAIKVISFCSNERLLELGRMYHALIIKNGVSVDQFVGTSLVDMYAKCGDMDSAVKLANAMSDLDVASCNCLISGYGKNGLFDEAFGFFVKLDDMDIEPSHYTYSMMVAFCGSFSAVEEGKQLHCQIVKLQYLSDTAVSNALLTMYSKCGMIDDAESLFMRVVKRNVVSWSAMINGYKQHGEFEKALKTVFLMTEGGIDPNEYTYSIALSSCAKMKDLKVGRMLHGRVQKQGMALGRYVGTTVVDMYSSLGEVEDAKKQLEQMGKSASSASWNAYVAGVIHNEKPQNAIEAFANMVKNKVRCDEFTYSTMLKACSLLPSLATCEQIHTSLVKTKYGLDMHVGSSLIEAYNKCGSVEDAERVFNGMHIADAVSWKSMIKAYSQNGHPTKALTLFRRMIKEGISPTNSTFLAVLSACSHSGLVEEGQKLFESMISDYNIQPEETHYSCMVDLLGRAGQLENSLYFINNLPINPNAAIWRPLLAACRYHNNLPMAEFVARKILELDPNDATVYVTLSNLYTQAGRASDAEKQRKLMTAHNVTKEPGCSWIEANNRIYRFYSHDQACPEKPKVYQKLKEVLKQMKTNAKEENLGLYHSEKLAVCFGLIRLPARKQIRVFKNLRVCSDCHSFMKYLSAIAEKEIVLRDNYRFHHFKQGCCSCGDFW